jgi:hypothetical protein
VINVQTSLANFIIELIQACEGNVRGIKRFSDLYHRCIEAWQKAYVRYLKQGKKSAAASWLAWNFAVKPFLKDFKNILCSISETTKKLKWLQNHNHKVIFLDYNRDDLGSLVNFDPDVWSDGQIIASVFKADPKESAANGTHAMCVKVRSVKISYHARSKIFLDIPDRYLEGMSGMQTLWGAMLGLENPVGIVWEAIPFSWLIDYFLSYRARLFQQLYDYNPYDAGVEVLGYGHSFKVEWDGTVALRRYYGGVWTTTQEFGGFQYSSYGRRAGLPFPEQTSLFRVPGDWYKLSILAALGVQLARRKH